MNERNLKGIKQKQTKQHVHLICVKIQNNSIIDIKIWGSGIV